MNDSDLSQIAAAAFLMETIGHLQGHNLPPVVVRHLLIQAEKLRDIVEKEKVR